MRWKKNYVISFIFVLISVFLYFNSSLLERKSIQINSLEELENIEQILSSRKLTEEEIVKALPYNSEYKEGDLSHIIIYEIKYETIDGAIVLGYISAPNDYLEKKYPIMIYNRGGHNIILEYPRRYLISQGVYCSEEGYISLQSYYREENHSEDGAKYDQQGGDDLNDVLTLMDITEHFKFNALELYMIGVSRGGMITYMILRQDDRVDAAVCIMALADAFEYYEMFPKYMPFQISLGGTPDEVPEEYEKRSAVKWANEIDTPLLLLHGNLDDRAPLSQSQAVYKLMKEAGKDVTIKVYEGIGHKINNEVNMDAFEWLKIKRLEK